MATCDVCGNEYDKVFEITHQNQTGVFDSFECAIAGMAPQCANCGTTIIGHDVADADRIYCCAHCARRAGPSEVTDRVS